MEIEELVRCPICLEFKQNQRVLPCGHTFCEADLKQLIQNKQIRCPSCRKLWKALEGVSSFFFNFDRNSLAAILKNNLGVETKKTSGPKEPVCCECKSVASVWCAEDNDFYCEEHDKQAHLVGKAKLHTRVPAFSKEIHLCRNHPENLLTQYCTKCEKPICKGEFPS